jgi:NDP-4-keto-2,6-dideoxyhexose 3-C-methyltransferase
MHTERARSELQDFVAKSWKEGKAVRGLGASTKGNVLLQYCEFTSDDIECIGEVNSEKFGRFTPGTHIPIVAEDTLFGPESSCVIVLPWHFREFFMASPRFAPLNLVFPLPRLESVAAR